MESATVDAKCAAAAAALAVSGPRARRKQFLVQPLLGHSLLQSFQLPTGHLLRLMSRGVPKLTY